MDRPFHSDRSSSVAGQKNKWGNPHGQKEEGDITVIASPVGLQYNQESGYSK